MSGKTRTPEEIRERIEELEGTKQFFKNEGIVEAVESIERAINALKWVLNE